MKTVKDLKLEKKRVLLRCDLNVPVKEGEVVDDFDIERVVPTIEYLIKKGAKVIIASHLGRPGGKVKEELRLDPVQDSLVKWLDRSVVKAPDCIGQKIEKWTENMKPGEVLLLENLRFRKGERENDKRFGRRLSRLADIYINEAFGASHRAHASLMRPPQFLPAGIGLLFEKEVKALNRVLENPKKPVVGVVGGVKKSKKEAVNSLLKIADTLLVGGKVGEELKKESLPQKVELPIDGIGKEKKVFDIGPKTRRLFTSHIKKAGTLFWAGPMGKFEEERFKKGTAGIARAIAESSAFSVVGGGDTVSFLRNEGLDNRGFSHISSGGGAMLTYLSQGTLPALESLK